MLMINYANLLFDSTRPNAVYTKNYGPDPSQPKPWVNPTHDHVCFQRFDADG